MNDRVLMCFNSYWMTNLSAAQVRDRVFVVDMAMSSNESTGDWRDYVPINLRRGWAELPNDLRIGVALMASACAVGAIGTPRVKQ